MTLLRKEINMHVSHYELKYMVIDPKTLEGIRRFMYKDSADYFAECVNGKVIKIDWQKIEGDKWWGDEPPF